MAKENNLMKKKKIKQTKTPLVLSEAWWTSVQSSEPTKRQEQTDSQELLSDVHMYAIIWTSLYL